MGEWMKDAEEIAPFCSESDDFMDEAIPFTKFTLDNLLGIVHNETSYKHYFDSFLAAQQKRVVEINPLTGQENKLDRIRKNVKWNYNQFLIANGTRKDIQQVVDIQMKLKQASGYA